MSYNTIVIDDETGEQIATYPGDLVQIEVGQPEFYVEQQNYEVVKIDITIEARYVRVKKR